MISIRLLKQKKIGRCFGSWAFIDEQARAGQTKFPSCSTQYSSNSMGSPSCKKHLKPSKGKGKGKGKGVRMRRRRSLVGRINVGRWWTNDEETKKKSDNNIDKEKEKQKW